MEHKKELQDYLDTLVIRKGSDVHLVVGSKPLFRVYRDLRPFIQKDILQEKDTENFFHILASSTLDDYQERFRDTKHLMFRYSHTTSGGKSYNFRVTVYREKGKVAIAMRLIQDIEKTIEELNLPSILKTITAEPRGLFLIVGSAGSGKSTTLAAMINHCNQTQRRHILTIEDPIEFTFRNKVSIITQREVPSDTPTFKIGLDSALRTDADILMIGEMRELETMQTTMTAAEVGHLVLSTVHANSAYGTIHRIIDSFDPMRQRQIGHQLASVLLGVCAIHLLPRVSGGLIPACEVLLNSPAVANIIREGRISELPTVIQTNRKMGMISLEQNLANLVRSNEISLETAHLYGTDDKLLAKYL